MFDGIKDSIYGAVMAIQNKYDSLADSFAKLNQDMLEIRNLFVGIKNVVSSVFSFMGQETAILLFCTFLFLFVFNLIPFLFFGKKTRYCIGMCFGVYLSIRFKYAFWSLVKYVLIMLSPILLEYILVLFFKTTGKSLWIVLKKTIAGLWKALTAFWQSFRKKMKKNKEDEK